MSSFFDLLVYHTVFRWSVLFGLLSICVGSKIFVCNFPLLVFFLHGERNSSLDKKWEVALSMKKEDKKWEVAGLGASFSQLKSHHFLSFFFFYCFSHLHGCGSPCLAHPTFVLRAQPTPCLFLLIFFI